MCVTAQNEFSLHLRGGIQSSFRKRISVEDIEEAGKVHALDTAQLCCELCSVEALGLNYSPGQGEPMERHHRQSERTESLFSLISYRRII